MPAPMLTHVAFNCPDIDAMVAFYRDYAGLQLGHDRLDGDLRVAWLTRDGTPTGFMLVLIGREGRQPDGPYAMEHLGFECDTRAEVDALIEKARAEGVRIVEGPTELPPPVGYFVIFADPSGNRVEFSYPPG